MKSSDLIGHGVLFVLILGVFLVLYWFMYRNVNPGTTTSDIVATVTQNTISSGLTAVSIVLPLTVIILGYSINQRKDAVILLFFACVVFTVSLFAGLWNLFRLPSLVKTVNVVNDMKTAFFSVIQLYSLLYGFIYLVLGAWKIVK